MIPAWYQNLFNQYQTLLNSKPHLYLALSAGIDSNVLLHWLYTYKAQLPPITAIHVNHQLHGEDSYIWANFAKTRAEHYGIPFINYDITLDSHDPMGVEAAGREARYRKFGQTMEGQGLLLVAHQRSDQAETLLFRLIRGSGVRGMGAIRTLTQVTFGPYTLEIFRPLLQISKEALYAAAKTQALPWMEDYTNHETDFTRNQIRNAILPQIATYFPAYERTFARSALFFQEAQDLLIEIAKETLREIAPTATTLNRAKLLALTPLQQKNVLRYWLSTFNHTMAPELFETLLHTFIHKNPTHRSTIALKGACLRYFQNHIYFIIESKVLAPTLHWTTSPNAPPQTFWEGLDLELMERINGMYFHPMGRTNSQSVKKLLQAANIPTWQRSSVQILVEKHSREVLWVEALGLTHSLAKHCNTMGVVPLIKRS